MPKKIRELVSMLTNKMTVWYLQYGIYKINGRKVAKDEQKIALKREIVHFQTPFGIFFEKYLGKKTMLTGSE